MRAEIEGLASELGRPIGLHLGLACGEVVAAPTGGTAHRAYTVTGEAVNLAARLTARAKPGEILLSAELQAALRSPFVVEPAGSFELKGLGTAPAWRLEARPGEVAAGHAGVFVGRAAELERVAAALQDARTTGCR